MTQAEVDCDSKRDAQTEAVEVLLSAASSAGVTPHSNRTMEDGTRVLVFRLFPNAPLCEQGNALFLVRQDGSGYLAHRYPFTDFRWSTLGTLDLSHIFEGIARCR